MFFSRSTSRNAVHAYFTYIVHLYSNFRVAQMVNIFEKFIYTHKI